MSKTFSYKQLTDYDCAAGAVAAFIYELLRLELDVVRTGELLGCRPDSGTPHGPVIRLVRDLVPAEYRVVQDHNLSLAGIVLPMIVNYQHGGEGHYGVLRTLHLSGGTGSVTVMDPSTGGTERHDWQEFCEGWYSLRYGRRWGLYATKK